MPTTQIPGLFIMETSDKGRGVFTSEPISEGSIIEICPCIILSPQDTLKIHETLLHDYYFLWETDRKTSALALGFGSIYNHSENPNASFLIDYDARSIKFVGLKDINSMEEITIDYIGLKKEGYKLWF